MIHSVTIYPVTIYSVTIISLCNRSLSWLLHHLKHKQSRSHATSSLRRVLICLSSLLFGLSAHAQPVPLTPLAKTPDHVHVSSRPCALIKTDKLARNFAHTTFTYKKNRLIGFKTKHVTISGDARQGFSIRESHNSEHWRLRRDGCPVEVKEDHNGDGKIDRVLKLMYTQGSACSALLAAIPRDAHEFERPLWARAHPMMIRYDDEADGTINRITRLKYSRAGRLIQEGFDEQADGKVDHQIWHKVKRGEYEREAGHSYPDSAEVSVRHPIVTRDSEGRLLTASQDANIAYSKIKVWYSYDAQGRLTQRTFDDERDDTIDRREVYDYGCWAR